MDAFPNLPSHPPSTDPSTLAPGSENEGSMPAMELINYFVDQEPIQTDLERGVSFLQKIGTCGTSVYEHIRQIIKKILETRPDNAIDFFEEFSRQIRLDSYHQKSQSFLEPWVSRQSLHYAKLQLQNFNHFATKEEASTSPEEAFDEEAPKDERKNYEELLNYLLPHIGLGFPKMSTLAFILAMRKLEKNTGLEKVRFWGQIYGLKKNYFVAEANLTIEERERRQLEMAENENGEGSVADAATLPSLDIPESVKSIMFAVHEENEVGEGRFEYSIPPLPVANFKKPVTIPPEDPGTGVNKKTYFVCNELGEDWTELPDVKPAQIVSARQGPCYLTGELDTPIQAFPNFPGTETNYLRAQIARISACCLIAPQGMYILDEEEEDDEDEEYPVKTRLVRDEEFEGQSLMNLLESNMEYWTHNENEILLQGRVVWFNPKTQSKDDEDKEDVEEEEDEVKKEESVVRQVGKDLLTSVAEDVLDEKTEAWTVKSSSMIDEGRAYAVAASNIWPGAYAFARETSSENIYFGWGLKYQPLGNLTPLQLPTYQPQFSYDITEKNDPTPEQEEDFRLAHEKQLEEEMAEDVGEEEEELEED